MICPSCGKKTMFDVVACGRCGYDFAARAAEARPGEHAPTAPAPTPGAITSDPPQGSGAGKIVAGLGMIVVGIVITTMSYSAASESGGRYFAPIGLVAYGVVLVIRGMSGR
jgi:hypothetical protein